ncbi:HK97 gp10 family phage protein [Celeribacter sp.]|uniref:HK97 gp10 family phage protein n=1 Tax=Celeribacter sp. TaxID=1890673 RepID=UPI003A9001D7
MKVKVEGLSDIEKALSQIEKAATRKASMRRALKKAGQPMADKMRVLAPRGETATDDLADSVIIGTKLSNRQKAQHKKMFKDDRAAVEMFVGPGPDPAAWNQEFGNVNHGAQPFARPAWDAEAMPTLERLSDEMWADIKATAERQARKNAKGYQNGA